MRILLLAAIVIGPALQAQSPTADVILVGGKVFTGDSTRSFAEALAVAGDRVLAVGTTAEIEALADARTRRIQLEGRVVIPGIHDAHYHSLMPPFGGRQLSFDQLDPAWEQTRVAVERAAREATEGTWIFGTVGQTVMLSPDATRAALDRVAPGHPVYLTTYYGHGDLFNTAAMQALRVAELEPDPPGGRFERDSNSQRLNGKAWEYAQWRLRRRLARLTPDDVIESSLRATSEAMLRLGIVAIDDMPRMDVDRYVRLRQNTGSPIRTRVISMPIPGEPDAHIANGRQDGRITVAGRKWILDGTPFEHGVALRGRYHDAPDRSGRMNFSDTDIASMIDEAASGRQPLLLHVGGDLTADTVLSAMERHAGVDWKAKRVRMEHGDPIAGDLLPRALALGVVIVQNPTHFSLRDLVAARYGADTPFFPLRTLLEKGVPVALGSDGPFNPYLNIMLASVHPVHPDEAITREQAVEAYTYGSAYAAFVENETGRLEPGKLADLAVLSQDIFTVSPESLPATESLLTIIGGEIVYGSLPSTQ